MAFFSRRKSPPPQSPSAGAPAASHAPMNTSAVGVANSTTAVDPDLTANVHIDSALEASIHEIGKEFLHHARSKQGGIFSSQFWSDKLMDWAMKDEAFKIQFFRFVDTYPSLTTPEQIHEHLVDYMTQPGVTQPPGMDLMTKAGGMAKGIFTGRMTKQITGMAKKFIAGENAAATSPLLHELWKKGMCFSVDLLGEACISQRVADEYLDKYMDLVNNLPTLVADLPANLQLESDYLGPIPRVNVSIKVTSLYWDVDPIDTEGSIDRLMDRLGPLLEAAGRNNVFINFDMEQYELKDLTLDLFERCCEKYDFSAGLALQAYLRSSLDDAKRLIAWSKRTGRQVTIRLVKGAYWDFETIFAEQHGYAVPVWSRKQDSDACYERVVETIVENMPRSANEGGVKLALGSHNARSISHALACVRKHNFPDSALELQMLHGMGDPLKAAALKMNLRMREYLPVGELLVGMAYFVRRLLENTSNESWLRASFSDDMSDEVLLANPLMVNPGEADPGIRMIEDGPEKHHLTASSADVGDGRPFFNEPRREFWFADVRNTFQSAIQDAEPPRETSFNQDVDATIANASRAQLKWSSTPVLQRAEVLINVARIFRARRDELAGYIIREAGYTWREADAEICDAIDYCELHARSAIPLFEPRRIGQFIGEWNVQSNQSRGVALCIPSWCHSLSTLTAMTTAALVTGNASIVIPAAGAFRLTEEFRAILSMAGVPEAVVQFLSAEPDAPSLIYNPHIATVVYAGHREKGLSLIQATGTTQKDQAGIKNVVAELGGKNAIIVDVSADLGEAVLAVRDSAFHRAGQSPFACSRAIVVDSAYDSFVKKLVESTNEMCVGHPLLCATSMGPIVSEDHARQIRNRLEKAQSEGRLANRQDAPPASDLMSGRPYILPHIFADVLPDTIVAQEEILGPVLAVIRARDFDEALDIANRHASGYAMAGAVYSRKPSNIDRVRSAFQVGNLYINAPIDSPRVGRQPIACMGRSGSLDNLRGSSDYLKHFVHARVIAENTMRRGFAPDL